MLQTNSTQAIYSERDVVRCLQSHNDRNHIKPHVFISITESIQYSNMIDNRRTRISLQKSNQAIIKRVYAINKSLINSHQSLDIAEAFLSLRFCYITQVFCHKQPSVSKLTNRITKYVIIRQNLDVNLLLLCLVKAIKLDPLSDS